MNRGVFLSSSVQQMMGENPSRWNMNNPRQTSQQTSHLLTSPSSSSSFSPAFPHYPQPSNLLPRTPWPDDQELPESWSQLLLAGLGEEEDRNSFTPFPPKRVENWEDQVMCPSGSAHKVDIKQGMSKGRHVYGHRNEEIQATWPSWSPALQTSSPRSCVTSLNSSMLDFPSRQEETSNHQQDHSSECNSTATGSAVKKARIQASSTQSTFKMSKEKLGDRITALHQLVSPFGKTDTASVLLETIGYIRFLQSQIEALCSPYSGSGPGSMRQSFLNDINMNRSLASDQDGDDKPKDLRSKGLCLIPVTMLHVGCDNGMDCWAPNFGGIFL